MDLLTQVKLLLGITGTDKDGILSYLISLVTGLALRYCRLSDTNDELNVVLAGMVVERYRANGYGQEAAPQTVSTVTVGNETVQFAKLRNVPENYIISNELTTGEKSALQPYRKLWP